MYSLKSHNILDYVLGSVLLVGPWLFGFQAIPEARVLFLLCGIAVITYSLMTKYAYSFTQMIPLGVHMTLDTIIGVVLILAPAMFGYRGLITEAQSVAHIIMGVGLVSLVALTKPKTEAAKAYAENAKMESNRKYMPPQTAKIAMIHEPPTN